MEYKIKEFGNNCIYKNNKYWFAENQNKDIIGIIEIREVGYKCFNICNVDCIQIEQKKDILEILLHKALEYIKANNYICSIGILDNMIDIKELLEKYKFELVYISNKDDDGISEIRYVKE